MQNKINNAKCKKNAKNAKNANANAIPTLNPNSHTGGIYQPQIFAALQGKGEKEIIMGKKAIRAKIRRQLDWALGQWEENGNTLPPEILQKFLTWAYQIFITPTHLFDNNKSNINKYNKFQTYINQNLQK